MWKPEASQKTAHESPVVFTFQISKPQKKHQAAARQLYLAIVFSLRLRCCIGPHWRGPFAGSVSMCWRGLVVAVDADELYDAGSPKAFGLTTIVGLNSFGFNGRKKTRVK